MKKRYYKSSVLICFGFAGVFSLFSLIFYFGDWIRLALVFFFGLLVGAIGIPEIEPKAVKNPKSFQTVVGLIAGSVGNRSPALHLCTITLLRIDRL